MPDRTHDLDLLIEARWMLPIEPAGVVLEDHAIAIRGGRIVDLLPCPVGSSRVDLQACKLEYSIVSPK